MAIIMIWGIVGLIKYMNKHSLLIWKKYTYYDNGHLKTMKQINFLGTGYLYTYRVGGSLFKKEYLHYLSILEDGYELYYPSGRLKYKHVNR